MRNGIQRVLISAALSTVVATTACSPAAGPTDGKPEPPAPAQAPLTKAQLTGALPAGAEVPGFTVKPQDLALLEAEDVVTADKAACSPISDMMSVRPRHQRQAMVWATMKPDGASPRATPGSLTLSSHAVEDAEAWMAELRTALAGCTEFTATSRRGWTYRFSVRPLSTEEVGDGSVAYLLTNTLAPDGKGNVMTIVRTAGTFATYLMNSDAEKPAPAPAAVATQQHNKLQAAASRP